MSDHKSRRALVTGGAGFLGSHIIDRLIGEGFDVLCVDNLLTGDMRNIAHLSDNPHFEFRLHDVCDPLDVAVDEIWNFACAASPVRYQNDPIHTTKTSVLGALNLLELARRRDIPILQASTSEVYGDPAVHPQTEEYWGNVNPIGPRSCYDEGKRCAETLFFDYRRQYGVKTKVARIFNTYGPRMHPNDGRVVSNLIVQALSGGDLTIYGDGSQTRSFCFVDDLVDGLFRLMRSPDAVTGPINLGNEREVTMLELAQAVLKTTGSTSRLKFELLPQDDPHRRRPDTRKAKEALGWRAQVELELGLRKTAAYFGQI